MDTLKIWKSKKKIEIFTAKKEFDSAGFFWVGRVWANYIFILAPSNALDSFVG
jgi:hypothetical protein